MKEPILIPLDLVVVKLVPPEVFKAQQDEHLAVNVNLVPILVLVLGNVLPVKSESSKTWLDNHFVKIVLPVNIKHLQVKHHAAVVQ